MMNITIIVLILIGLTIHRYLSSFWEQGMLPYSIGFILFANLFAILYLVAFIWMFGSVAGIIISVLAYFQVVYSTGLWVFSLPWLVSMHRNIAVPRVNPMVYGGFSFLVIVLGVLTAANFFISQYMSIWDVLGHNYKMAALVFVVVLILGNIVRVSVMSKLMKE